MSLGGDRADLRTFTFPECQLSCDMVGIWLGPGLTPLSGYHGDEHDNQDIRQITVICVGGNSLSGMRIPGGSHGVGGTKVGRKGCLARLFSGVSCGVLGLPKKC